MSKEFLFLFQKNQVVSIFRTPTYMRSLLKVLGISLPLKVETLKIQQRLMRKISVLLRYWRSIPNRIFLSFFLMLYNDESLKYFHYFSLAIISRNKMDLKSVWIIWFLFNIQLEMCFVFIYFIHCWSIVMFKRGKLWQIIWLHYKLIFIMWNIKVNQK